MSKRLFKRIVVGYDGSFEAHAALRFALDVADEDTEVIAVATVPLHNTVAAIGPVEPTQPLDSDACWHWVAAAAAYARDCGQRIETRVYAGPVARALSASVADVDADLLVIGASRHRRGRSILADLSRTDTCPTLVVRR